MISFCWHGVAGYSLKIDGLELTVDPFFADRGGFGLWFKENSHKPSYQHYFELVKPEIVLITHSHYEHCCLKTLERITAEKQQLKLIAGKTVLTALRKKRAVSEHTEMVKIKPGQQLELEGIGLKAFKAAHCYQGILDRYIALRSRVDSKSGFSPVIAGATPLSYLVSNGKEKYFLSGDAKLKAIPKIDVDYAIVNLGTYLPHPLMHVPFEPLLTLKDIPRVIERLNCKTIVLTHFDWRGFLKQLTGSEIEGYLKTVVKDCRILIPTPNCWLRLY